MGEEAAWQFMEQLHKNVGVYTSSGTAPCVQAARGERAIGLSFDMRAIRERAQGAPVEVVIPEDGVGWEMGAMAIVARRPVEQMQAAMRIVEWATGAPAHTVFARYFGVVARRDIASPAGVPSGGRAAHGRPFRFLACRQS